MLVAAMALLSGCSSTPGQEQVRAAISAGAAAAERGDAGAFEDILSADFVANDGRLDRRRLLAMLRMRRLRGGEVGVLLGPVDIEARGQRLLAEFTVTLSGGRGLLPDDVGVYSVRTAWRLEDGDWRCYSASWTRTL